MAHEKTSTLESLARGEQSAVDAYDQALSKLGDTKGGSELRRLRAEHLDAAERLRQHVRAHGGSVGAGAGAWGAFVRLVEGAAKALGTDAALKALKEGEEHGIKAYEDALGDRTCLDDCLVLVRELQRRAREHVPMLDRLMAGLAERIPASEARQHVRAGALLVCAYDDEEKCRQNRLEGSISLDEFKQRVESLPKERELIFYCA
jgi:rhodanese-related sulfurtransferase